MIGFEVSLPVGFWFYITYSRSLLCSPSHVDFKTSPDLFLALTKPGILGKMRKCV